MPGRFDWQRGFNRNLILGKLKEARKSDGRSFDAGEYEFWLPVLSSAIRSSREAEPLKAKCISASPSDASLKLNDPDASLFDAIKNLKSFHKGRCRNLYFIPPLPTRAQN